MTPALRAALAVLVAATALSVGPLHAQEAAQSPGEQSVEARETPWQVNCTPAAEGGTMECSMVKSLVQADGDRIFAQAAVVAGEPFTMRLLAPHGMSLAEGVKVQVDGREVAAAAYRTSLPGGVVAVIDLTPELEGTLRFGNQMRVEGVQNNGAALAFQLSLSGFAASIDKLR
jgi:invasion protein IalB